MRQGAYQCERDHVHHRDTETCALDRVHVGANHVLLGRSQQDADAVTIVSAGQVLDNLEVEDGILDRNGDELLRLEAQCGCELLLTHGRHLCLAHDHALVGYAQHNSL